MNHNLRHVDERSLSFGSKKSTIFHSGKILWYHSPWVVVETCIQQLSLYCTYSEFGEINTFTWCPLLNKHIPVARDVTRWRWIMAIPWSKYMSVFLIFLVKVPEIPGVVVHLHTKNGMSTKKDITNTHHPIIASKPRHIWLSSQLFEQRLVFFLSQDGIAWNQAILVKGLLHFRWTMGYIIWE